MALEVCATMPGLDFVLLCFLRFIYFSLYEYFIGIYVHVYMYCITTMPSALRGQKAESDPLELELQRVVRHRVSTVLGTESGSSARASVLNR